MVPLLLGCSCAQSSKNELTNDENKPSHAAGKLTEASSEKIFYVGMLDAQSEFHPLMKEFFLSANYFDVCLQRNPAGSTVLHWQYAKNQLSLSPIDRQESSVEFSSCVEQGVQAWIKAKSTQKEKLSQASSGVFYIGTSKPSLKGMWPKGAEKYYWTNQPKGKQRMMQ